MFKILFYISIMLIFKFTSVSAEDFKTINLKYTLEHNESDLLDADGAFLELETIIVSGRWDLYGFSDFRFMNNDYSQLNFDFYKYILKYDITGNGRFYISTKIQETYNFSNDVFLGLGTSLPLPILGSFSANIYYFAGKTMEDSNSSINVPLSIGLNWFNLIYTFSDNLNLTHGGWMDIDPYTKLSNDDNTTGLEIQFYEGIALNYKSYAIELGYKYWYNTFGVNNETSNSEYLYFIKRF